MKKFLRIVGEWAIIILAAFVMSLLLRNFLVDSRIVPTGSMIPTIQEQDRVLVDRLFYKWDTLERGDIIVFAAPEEAGENKDLVKRLIGLPGEEVEIRNGRVWIDGKSLNEPYLAEPINYKYGPITVEEGNYFVLGDNRNWSKDSHYWGLLDQKNVIGRVWIRYWPFNNFGPLTRPPDPYFND